MKGLLLAAAALVALVLPAAAAAHGTTGHGYISTVDHIVDASGVDAQASADGHFIFHAPAGKTVVVDGYTGEPYVKFQGGKVYENERSESAYVNRNEAPPANLGGPPQWKQVGDGLTYTWHDHRTHWMGTDRPAVVRADPKVRHHISDWKIGGTVSGKRFTIVGSLDWAPLKPGLGWQWLLVPVVAGGALYAIGITLIGARRRRPQPG